MRARARAVFVARERAAQAELEQLEQLEEQQAVALSSPSTPTIERELKEIEGELQRIVLSASLPASVRVFQFYPDEKDILRYLDILR